MTTAASLLRSGGHALVVVNRERVRTFDGRGVSDLYALLTEEPDWLHGAEVADKVVGKGAAALMIRGGVRRLFAEVVSRGALELLETSDTEVEYATVVPHIADRKGTGICPVERLCLDCTTAEACLPRIERFLREKREKQEGRPDQPNR